MRQHPLRVLIACGGTGGHLFPGIAVAEELQRRGHETLLVLSEKRIDALASDGKTHLKRATLPSIGWPGLSPRLLQFVRELVRGYGKCRTVLNDFKPDVVLGMGGFTCVLPLWLAQRRRIPTLLHESNAYPGKATRLLSKRVRRVLLGFEEAAQHLPNAQCRTTGTPVRADLNRIEQSEARRELGLKPDRTTVAVMGGSQGASGINHLIMLALVNGFDRDHSLQWVHLTGARDYAKVEAAYQTAQTAARVREFETRMDLVYSAADLVISRSGAASLTELAHYGLPSLLIPFPEAADDHQRLNARVFERAGASRIIPQGAGDEVSLLVRELRELVNAPARRAEMAAAAQRLSKPNAHNAVADEVEQCRN